MKSIRSIPTGCFQGLLNLYFSFPHKFIACLTLLCAAAEMSVKSQRAKTTVKSTKQHFWKYLPLLTLLVWPCNKKTELNNIYKPHT